MATDRASDPASTQIFAVRKSTWPSIGPETTPVLSCDNNGRDISANRHNQAKDFILFLFYLQSKECPENHEPPAERKGVRGKFINHYCQRIGLQYLYLELAASAGDTALQDTNIMANNNRAKSFCIGLILNDRIRIINGSLVNITPNPVKSYTHLSTLRGQKRKGPRQKQGALVYNKPSILLFFNCIPGCCRSSGICNRFRCE